MEKFTSFQSNSMWMLAKMNGEMKPAATPVPNAIIVFAAVVIICPWPNGGEHFDAAGSANVGLISTTVMSIGDKHGGLDCRSSPLTSLQPMMPHNYLQLPLIYTSSQAKINALS